MRSLLLIFLVSAVAVTTGCSFSNSSESISDSISSPSKSSSDSSKSSSDSSGSDGDSGGGDAPAPESAKEAASYRKDVSELTVTYLERGGEFGAFRAAVTQLAEARGITDWEGDAATTRAIGSGARRAGLDESEFEIFSTRLVGDDPMRLDDLRIGYQPSTSASAPTAPDA